MRPLLLALLLVLPAQAAYNQTPSYEDVSVALPAGGTATVTNTYGFACFHGYVDVPGTTTVNIECSADGATWDSCSLRSTESDVFGSDLAADGHLIGSIASTTDIRLRGSSTSNNTVVVGFFDGVLEAQ